MELSPFSRPARGIYSFYLRHINFASVKGERGGEPWDKWSSWEPAGLNAGFIALCCALSHKKKSLGVCRWTSQMTLFTQQPLWFTIPHTIKKWDRLSKEYIFILLFWIWGGLIFTVHVALVSSPLRGSIWLLSSQILHLVYQLVTVIDWWWCFFFFLFQKTAAGCVWKQGWWDQWEGILE